jgi:hypothetical protein
VKWCFRVHVHWLGFTLPSFSAPSSAAGALAAASAPADVSALAGAKVAPVATAAVDELVPVRAMSSLTPDSLGAMIPQPLERGNSERAGTRWSGRRYFAPRDIKRAWAGATARRQSGRLAMLPKVRVRAWRIRKMTAAAG